MVEAGGGSDPQDVLSQEYEEARESFDVVSLIIGTLLCLFVMWMSGNLGGSSKVEGPPMEQDDRETPFTIEEIRKYNGKGPDGKIYIGCNGFVFDVTSSENYQPGGDYELFCGYDISVACANYSTDEKYLGVPFDPDNNNLNFSQE